MTGIGPIVVAMTNSVQLASVRVITEDLPRLVRFYEAVTGATAQWLTEDFAELVTPSATFALSHPGRVSFIGENAPRAAANSSAIVEFLVDDVDDLFTRLAAELGDDLVVVQPPTLMPWGNRSVLLRDPDGALINLYTPVTPEALQLQRRRRPQLLQWGRTAFRSGSGQADADGVELSERGRDVARVTGGPLSCTAFITAAVTTVSARAPRWWPRRACLSTCPTMAVRRSAGASESNSRSPPVRAQSAPRR